MNRNAEDEIPAGVLEWVVGSVRAGSRIIAVQRLQGGMSSVVHRVSLAVEGEESGGIQDVVLRQFDNAEWLRNEPDLARHEAESLRWAARTAIPTPQIIAYDETGNACGVPAVLMTRLEGSVVLEPTNQKRWLKGLAQALVQIHSIDADHFPWAYFTYNDVAKLQTPEWSSYPELWNQAFEIVRGTRPAAKIGFIHRDYHPTNVLWDGDQVSGVVDWVNACRGPAGIDVGHCRLNLAMLYGVQTADGFLTAYDRYSGSAFSYHPYWDLLSLIDILFGPPTVYPGWTALGVTGLTDELMARRLDQYVVSLVRRVNEFI